MTTRTIIGKQHPAQKISRRLIAASVGFATVLATGLLAGPDRPKQRLPFRC